jgi:enoyl-CoA hydratase
MSFTGNFMLADEAYDRGLVNHVVPHADLIPFTRQIARDIAGNDQPGVRQIRGTYGEIHAETAGWTIEARDGAVWRKEQFSTEKVEERRRAIQDRGRQQ